jgi:hypothetical protein
MAMAQVQFDMSTLDAADSMMVFVQDEGATSRKAVQVHNEATLGELRDLIMAQTQVSLKEQTLRFQGQTLKAPISPDLDEKTLHELKIGTQTVITLVGVNFQHEDAPKRKPPPPAEAAPRIPVDNDVKVEVAERERERKEKTPQARRPEERGAKKQGRPQQRGPAPNVDKARLKDLVHGSKIHCRCLIVLFELALFLFIEDWGDWSSMLQNFSVMICATVGWYGVRTVEVKLVALFFIYITLEILFLVIDIIYALATGYESVYGTVGWYVTLLTIETVCFTAWYYYLIQFVRKVMETDPVTLFYTRKVTRTQTILI